MKKHHLADESACVPPGIGIVTDVRDPVPYEIARADGENGVLDLGRYPRVHTVAHDIVERTEVLVDVGDAHRLEAHVVDADDSCGGSSALDLSPGQIDPDERALRKRDRHRQQIPAGRTPNVEHSAAPNVRRRESAEARSGGYVVGTGTPNRPAAVRDCVVAS